MTRLNLAKTLQMREKQIHERYKTLAGQIQRYRNISDSINEDKIEQFKYG